MASIQRYKINGKEYCKLTDTSTGRRIQYAVNLKKYSQRQWLAAHDTVMRLVNPQDKRFITSKQFRVLATEWLQTPKKTQAAAFERGISVNELDGGNGASIREVMDSYLSDFCRPEKNSENAISKARRHCMKWLSFLEENKIFYPSQMKREIIRDYPEWRNRNRSASANTLNQEIRRFSNVVRHGVKFCGWTDNYALEGLRVKPTPENTKSVRPFEIAEVKAILAWFAGSGNLYLHDMALLSVCTGMEAKALTLLRPEWFKMDMGILRVYDKLVSGILDAKTQNRARDIPLTPTLRKIFERGNVFERPEKLKGRVATKPTPVKDYSSRAFDRCERETGIKDVNWHRFRHTCATARLSAGWQLVRVSRMLGHSSINTTATHYAEYDLSASTAGFEGMLKVYAEFVNWLDEGYFT